MKSPVRTQALSLALTMAGAISLTPALAADAPTGGDKRVRTFVLNNMYLASDGGSNSCPIMSESSLDIFSKTLSPEERAKYTNTDNRSGIVKLFEERMGFRRLGITVKRREQTKLPPGFDTSLPMTLERAKEIAAYNGFPKDRGRPSWGGKEVVYNSCSNPEDFPQLAKGHQIYKGKVAAGMNLDGKNGAEDFVGLDGTKGVDNQLWRAMGCVKSFRDDTLPSNVKSTILSAIAPTIVEVRDIDDIRNDPDVTVHVYAGVETLTRDGKGDPLAGFTFTPRPETRFHSTVRGRITDGVLLTDPVDLRLQFKEQVVLDMEREMRGMRIRAIFKPNGGIEGSLNGYVPVANFWQYMEQRTIESSYPSGYSCPAVHKVIDQLADGYRDPKTGRYTAISSSYNFVGVRAFLMQPTQTAANEVTP